MLNVHSLHRMSCRLWAAISRKVGNVLIILVLLVGLIGWPMAAYAETEAIQPLPAEVSDAASETADIAADKIDQFAQAYLQVVQLLSDREPELPAAETSAEALKLQRSIESEAIELIKGSGLTMPEYMQILSLASQDETFRDKVLGRMDEAAETP